MARDREVELVCIDVSGTIAEGSLGAPLPGAVEAVRHIAERLPVRFVTNVTSQPARAIVDHLRKERLLEDPDALFTPATTARRVLEGERAAGVLLADGPVCADLDWFREDPEGPSVLVATEGHDLRIADLDPDGDPAVRTILLTLVLFALATPALATDGVLEINQTCAVETGCFAGDTAGFPVTIIEPERATVLTSRLIVPDENTDGILISTSDVGIDLNGFAIVRSGCEGATDDCSTCARDRLRRGRAPSSSNNGISVKNGSITGMGCHGVVLGNQTEVTNLRVRWNGSVGSTSAWSRPSRATRPTATGATGSPPAMARPSRGTRATITQATGFETGAASTVSGNTVYENRSDGISASFGSTVSAIRPPATSAVGSAPTLLRPSRATRSSISRDVGISAGASSTVQNNTVQGTALDGIQAGDGCNIRDNTVSSAALDGISVGFEASVSRNVVSDNSGRGISASTSANVIGNSANSNGSDGIFTGNASTVRSNTVNLNGGDGLEVGDGSNVSDNVARSNGDFGLRAESTLVGFSQNVFGNNNGGPANPQTSSGTNLGGNQCDTSTTCP